MDMMELRRALLQPHIKTIGGIPVYVDNAKYDGNSQKINQYVADSNWFITGVFDTGTSSAKSLTYSAYPTSVDSSYIMLMTFNDLNANYTDYWGVKNNELVRTNNIPGRYIVFPVYKPMASTSFMYDNSRGIYLFKGKDARQNGVSE